METTRKCSACGEEKNIDSFEVSKNKKRRQCKICRGKIKKKWRDSRRELIYQSNKKWLDNHPDRKAEYKKLYRKRHPDKTREERKRHTVKYKVIKIRIDKDLKEYKKIVSDRNKEWKKNNPEKIKEYSRRQWVKRKQNIMTRLHRRITGAVGNSLHGNKQGRSWESFVGYSCATLHRHLEKRFLPGMSWNNRGNGI